VILLGDLRGHPGQGGGDVVSVRNGRIRPLRVMALLILAGTLLASGCATQGGSAPPAAAPSSAAPAPPAYAAKLQPELTQLAKDMLVSGAVIEVRSPQLGDWTTTLGTRTYHGTDPVQVGDHIRIGSVTKTWVGTVVLQLVQEGRLALTDPIAKYRPDVPNGQNITIEQLLDMRSGLNNYTTSIPVNQRMDADPQAVFQPEQLIKVGLAMPPKFPPGTGFLYSNTNTLILGRLVEQITGHPLPTEIQNRILTPLGLSGSSFPALTDSSLPRPRTDGYAFGTNVETVDSNVLPPAQQAAAKAGTLMPTDRTLDNPSWGWAAGAGISTAGDLVKYAQALVGGGLLNPQMQQQRLASVKPVDPKEPQSAGYGLALAQFGPLYGHTGELPGYNTFVGYDPQRKITVVVWAATAPSPDGRAPATTLARTIIGELYKPGG
jgi:D-alanyl-D-alanine carboxypeptidase